jgi:hypothetical protein
MCSTHPNSALAADVLLAALADARQRKEQAAQDMRLLLAYAREFSFPRPYRLADLAKAAGMSISGIRTAYTPADIEAVSILLAVLRQEYPAPHPAPVQR